MGLVRDLRGAADRRPDRQPPRRRARRRRRRRPRARARAGCEPVQLRRFLALLSARAFGPRTRALHYAGTSLVVLIAIAAVVTPLVAAAGRRRATAFAWAAHAAVERNRPATFTYPLWSLAADFRMWGSADRAGSGPSWSGPAWRYRSESWTGINERESGHSVQIRTLTVGENHQGWGTVHRGRNGLSRQKCAVFRRFFAFGTVSAISLA